MLKRILTIAAILLAVTTTLNAQTPKIRISAWYWLNSAPRTDWQGDFVTMKNLGITGVLLAWGVKVTGMGTRVSQTQQAIRLAHEAGLRSYIIVWQPYSHGWKQNPEFMQVDSNGKMLGAFDVFNPEWRSTEWKSYLQKLARAYGKEPGFSGYVFDDSFGAGGTQVISYGDFEKKAFGEPLPTKPGEPRWNAWVKAREGWWADWARDTTSYIRAIDPNRNHVIYLEDTVGSITNPTNANSRGLDFNRVAKYFDAVGGYTMTSWNDSPDSGEKAAETTTNAIKAVRKLIGPKKEIIYTFWVANPPEERKPGMAKYPTAEQIKLICQAALKQGIRHLDMYGYRIGDYRLYGHPMSWWVPDEPAPYVLTGQFPQKFLWDRPQVHQKLADYLRSLNQR